MSEQRSQSKTLSSKSGGGQSEFNLSPLDYESNKHYFLSHYFRKNYDNSLKSYPYIDSQVRITRIEVWITNRSNDTENVRNLIAFQDLAEIDPKFTNADRLLSLMTRYTKDHSHYNSVKDKLENIEIQSDDKEIKKIMKIYLILISKK